jgi:ribose-phosphate pyrophosphokinase
MSENIGTIQWAGWIGEHQQTGEFRIQSYPSGEPMIAHPAVEVQVQKLLLRPRSMLDLMGGLFFVDALVERGQKPPELILPFVPGARQDRLNNVGDYLFTAKSVANEINARNFPKVTVLDPHSEVISALINRCHVVHAHECFRTMVEGYYDGVVSPDAGAEKRASAVAKKLRVPLLHGWKTRNVATGEITGFGLERSDVIETPRPRVLVVDDICDGGRTFIGLGGVLKERGLRADLYVTHGLFSQGTSKLLVHYDKIICTDSVEAHNQGIDGNVGIDIIKVCNQLLEGN